MTLAKPSQTGPARILLVEDDPGIRQALDTLFGVLGVSAEWASNVSEARSLILGRAPDFHEVVIVDGRLPDGHGTHLIREFQDKMPDQTRFFLFTAEEISIEDLRESGLKVEGWIRKPFDSDLLIGLISRYSQGRTGG